MNDDFEWTDEEMAAIHKVANWYAQVVVNRGQERPDHPLRALLGVAMETYVSNQRQDAMQREAQEAALDDVTLERLTAEPATAAELAAIAGILAQAMGASAGITDHEQLMHHRAMTVTRLLAAVRLRNQEQQHRDAGGSYVQ